MARIYLHYDSKFIRFVRFHCLLRLSWPPTESSTSCESIQTKTGQQRQQLHSTTWSVTVVSCLPAAWIIIIRHTTSFSRRRAPYTA